MLFVITLSFSVSAWAINDDDALMLYFTFDEDEGGKVTDVSGNNLEGVFEGAVWNVFLILSFCASLHYVPRWFLIKEERVSGNLPV